MEKRMKKDQTREFFVEELPSGAHEQSRSLWRQVFPEDSDRFLDAYYAKKGRDNQILVCRDKTGEICGMIHWNPVALCFYGKPVTTDFLVAVAVRKDMRRQGIMRTLLWEGLRRRAAEGMPFVFLTPAKEAYYTPFGFVAVGASYGRHLCQVNGDRPGKRGEKDVSWEIRPLLRKDYESAAARINRWLEDSGSLLYAARSRAYLETLQAELESEGGGIMEILENGCPKGVFLYTEEGGLEIRELLCEKKEYLRLWKGLQQWRKEEDPLVLGCDPNLPEAAAQSVTMVRIASLSACVSFVKTASVSRRFLLVEDPLIPENDGAFCMELTPEGGSLTPLSGREISKDGGPAGKQPERVSIGELTKQLFCKIYLQEIV